MLKQRITRQLVNTSWNGDTIPVARLWYGGAEITVAFAEHLGLPLFPLEEGAWGVLATAGSDTLRTWSNEFAASCELQGSDMAYPRIVREKEEASQNHTSIPNWLFEVQLAPFTKWVYVCLLRLFAQEGKNTLADTKDNIVSRVQEMGTWRKPPANELEEIARHIWLLHYADLISLDYSRWRPDEEAERWTITLLQPTEDTIDHLKRSNENLA
ncbi:MAG: hypothetical protein J2P36_35920 [Ktedonobacteraceae bacterium]|nr:hypothetical protein [Ktedonobacteraceae bacterium]